MSNTAFIPRPRFIEASDAEWRALLWAFGYFFCLLASYFILRPLRDEMGVAAGVENLQWLMTGTFAAMLVASPLFAALTTRLPRARLIPAVYHLFAVNLLLFWVPLSMGLARSLTAVIFFVWVSVFNLFAVSIFWSFMADMFRPDQGKRLFGFIAAGGSAGTLLGSTITVSLSTIIGVPNLLLAAALLLELAVFCAGRLETVSAVFNRDRESSVPGTSPKDDVKETAPLARGGMFGGFRLLAGSSYLSGIGLWVLLLSFSGTFLYFIQMGVVAAISPDPAVRASIFAATDLTANLLTLLLLFFATGPVISRLGTGPVAASLPLVFVFGFAALALAPGLWMIAGFQALQRTANFAFANPARELLFTVVSREEKYQAKNLIDAALFRGGDLIWSWTVAGLKGLGLGTAALSGVGVPVAILWLGLSLWLGSRQTTLAQTLNRSKEIGKNDPITGQM